MSFHCIKGMPQWMTSIVHIECFRSVQGRQLILLFFRNALHIQADTDHKEGLVPALTDWHNG